MWLIVAVVLLFTAFPPAFAAITTRLHVPLTALLVGIVLRGSALVFRQYGAPGAAARWQRVFAATSAVTPFFLGASLGAVTAGSASQHDLMAWATPLPFATGAAAIAVCAYLAAVYLTVEATSLSRGRVSDDPDASGDRELAELFRRRATWSWIAVAAAAAICAAVAWHDAPHFAARLFGSAWSEVLVAAAVAAAIGALVALRRRRYRLARALAIAQATAFLGGWGAAHAPHLIAPDLTIRGAAAPPATLAVLVPVLIAGAVPGPARALLAPPGLQVAAGLSRLSIRTSDLSVRATGHFPAISSSDWRCSSLSGPTSSTSRSMRSSMPFLVSQSAQSSAWIRSCLRRTRTRSSGQPRRRATIEIVIDVQLPSAARRRS